MVVVSILSFSEVFPRDVATHFRFAVHLVNNCQHASLFLNNNNHGMESILSELFRVRHQLTFCFMLAAHILSILAS